VSRQLLIITAPSGAGKTTIVRYLLGHFRQLAFSISATTRPKRDHETDGVDYYFLDHDTFQEKIRQHAFAEYEEVYPGRWYGTLRTEMDRLWNDDKCIVFDIDVLGALNLQSQYPEESLSMFIAPPSLEVLENRLRSRGTETPESLTARLQRAAMELERCNSFDQVIINDDLETACQKAARIVTAFLS